VAESVFRRSFAASADPHTQRLLGDALAAQNSAQAAVDVYREVLSSTDVPADRQAASSGIESMNKVLGQ